jgi:hypothetical protein
MRNSNQIPPLHYEATDTRARAVVEAMRRLDRVRLL